MKLIILFFSFFFIIVSYAQNKNKVIAHDTIVKTISPNKINDALKTDAKNITFNVERGEKNWIDLWLPLIAALIVAFVAYKGVIKQSKATSISGFRVNWIEDLRVSYSKFLIALRNVDNKIRNGEIDPNNYSKDVDEEDLQFLKTKIKLLLNHNPITNPEHVAFYEQLLQYMEEHKDCIRGQFSDEKLKALDSRKAMMEEVLLNIFKKEWEKAKKFG